MPWRRRGLTSQKRRRLQVVEGMKNLQKFHWATSIIPLNARICSALAKAEHLQEVSVGPCGQFYISSELSSPRETQNMLILAPLHRLFPKPAMADLRSLEIFPSSRQFLDANEAFGQPPDESLDALADCYQEGRGVIKIPNPDRYPQYTYQDDAVEAELNLVERPLAMLYRTLMASRGRVRHVQTTELALARVQDFLPIWAQTALKGMDII